MTAGGTTQETAPRPPARVLIAEDSEAQARLDEALVRSFGLEVVGIVPTGRGTLERAAGADILILDYQLEDDLDGLAVLREVRARAYALKVIMTTAHGSEQVAAEALRLGADDYLMKDPGFAELLPTVLRRVLYLRDMERQLADAQALVVRSQRKAAIGEIIVAVSHEMNNPLMALRAELDLMRLTAESLPPRAQTGITQAIIQLDRISEVLKRLVRHESESVVSYVGDTKMTDLGK